MITICRFTQFSNASAMYTIKVPTLILLFIMPAFYGKVFKSKDKYFFNTCKLSITSMCKFYILLARLFFFFPRKKSKYMYCDHCSVCIIVLVCVQKLKRLAITVEGWHLQAVLLFIINNLSSYLAQDLGFRKILPDSCSGIKKVHSGVRVCGVITIKS